MVLLLMNYSTCCSSHGKPQCNSCRPLRSGTSPAYGHVVITQECSQINHARLNQQPSRRKPIWHLLHHHDPSLWSYTRPAVAKDLIWPRCELKQMCWTELIQYSRSQKVSRESGLWLDQGVRIKTRKPLRIICYIYIITDWPVTLAC